MSIAYRSVLLAALLVLTSGAVRAIETQDGDLTPDTQAHRPLLTFDWPAVEIGVGSYEKGPTGLTVFRFPDGAAAVVDVRGGAPGTVNTDMLRLGAEDRFLDAIVFTGGSLYGQEAIAAIASGLKDEGIRSSRWNNLAIVAGAEVYDFYRLNEIYPDKALARAVLEAMRPGVFPLGAQGAGRGVMQGSLFKCGAHSGQGGAFRQIGAVKIATFVVVNAVGVVTDRDGKLERCHLAPGTETTKTADLLARAPLAPEPPESRDASPATHNTTLSLVVTNRKLSYAELKRLAIEVHTSMARAIQPFSTSDDGDILFAVSTQEVEDNDLRTDWLNVIAGEMMWDAILSSVPDEPQPPPIPTAAVDIPPERLASYTGAYRFGPTTTLNVRLEAGVLMVETPKNYFDLRIGQPAALHPVSQREFYVDGRYRTRVSFLENEAGRITGAIINPGPWQQVGMRVGE